MNNPILMIQWLKPGEYRETRDIVQDFAGKNPPLGLLDVSSVNEFCSALQSLETDGDCQFLELCGACFLIVLITASVMYVDKRRRKSDNNEGGDNKGR